MAPPFAKNSNPAQLPNQSKSIGKPLRAEVPAIMIFQPPESVSEQTVHGRQIYFFAR
jgi:hypothetical protein